VDGLVYSVQGNILIGPEVVDAMANALQSGDIPEIEELTANEERALGLEDFAGRLFKALIAGQQLGGDSRGMQSAALIVCQAGAGYGGYTDVKYDLRVDDAADPFDELARLLNLARPFALITEGYNYAYAGDFQRAFETFEFLIELDPADLTHHYHYACALALAGDSEAALEHLRIALDFDPEMIQHAREDPDLASLHELDEFWRIAGGE
jgi:tetratricopeptide (TPR) repeat protein